MAHSQPDRTDVPLDATLLQRAQSGDGDAFGVLTRCHLPSIRAFVASKLPVAHVVDEITHETFVFAFQNLIGMEIHTSFRAWLRAIAFNLVRRELLRFARERENLSRLEKMQLDVLLHDSGEESGRDEAEFLSECVGTLPESMQRLVHQRYQVGKSSGELAEEWRRSNEWIRVTLLRVRRQLKECIERKMISHG